MAERMVETPAELPFIGDQVVCLSHNQGRPQRAEEGGAAEASRNARDQNQLLAVGRRRPDEIAILRLDC